MTGHTVTKGEAWRRHEKAMISSESPLLSELHLSYEFWFSGKNKPTDVTFFNKMMIVLLYLEITWKLRFVEVKINSEIIVFYEEIEWNNRV